VDRQRGGGRRAPSWLAEGGEDQLAMACSPAASGWMLKIHERGMQRACVPTLGFPARLLCQRRFFLKKTVSGFGVVALRTAGARTEPAPTFS
jgi:hypothetical protein